MWITPKSYGSRLSRANEGTASVEFVLVLPLLALLLFGTIEVGRLLFDYHAASKSVRDATRYLTRISGSDLGLTCAGVDNAAPAVTEAKNLVLRGSVDTSRPYLLSYWTDPDTITISVRCIPNTDDPKLYQGLYADDDQIVSITVTANVTVPLLNGWLIDQGSDLTFAFSHEEAHFGE